MVANPLLLMEPFQGGEWILQTFLKGADVGKVTSGHTPVSLKVITRSLSGAHLH